MSFVADLVERIKRQPPRWSDPKRLARAKLVKEALRECYRSPAFKKKTQAERHAHVNALVAERSKRAAR